jgi:hypothetical protein
MEPGPCWIGYGSATVQAVFAQKKKKTVQAVLFGWLYIYM